METTSILHKYNTPYTAVPFQHITEENALKSHEKLVASQSDYYIYSPSQVAKKMLFYPLYIGNFIYNAGYHLSRDSFDSYLLMYIRRGYMTLELEGKIFTIPPGSFAFIDCYRPHSYDAISECECLWIHFDGPTAQAWYQAVISHLGNVFTIADPISTISKMELLYKTFHSDRLIKEPLISQYINDILTEILLDTSNEDPASTCANRVEKAISYIKNHFAEDIVVDQLAAYVGLSLYHFIRIFTEETGLTPHRYLIDIRLNTAKYLLKNSTFSIKDICYNTGFSNESVFCSSFKKHLGITPTQYRLLNSDDDIATIHISSSSR